MKRLLKKAAIFFVFSILLNVTASTDTVYGFEQLKIAYQNGNATNSIFLQAGESEDLRFLGAPSNWASLHPTWNSYDEKIATVDKCGVVTAESEGWTIVCLRLDNDMIGVVFVYVIEPTPETSVKTEDKLPVEEEQKEKTLEVILHNQEIIHVPSNAEFADGTPVKNMIDIARYAFSYATTSGDLIIPTYEDDKYGISELVDVDYSTIKGPKTVIVKNVYFKVYLDLNKDGIISRDEKTSDMATFYYIKVLVDRTLTIEEWNMVQ